MLKLFPRGQHLETPQLQLIIQSDIENKVKQRKAGNRWGRLKLFFGSPRKVFHLREWELSLDYGAEDTYSGHSWDIFLEPLSLNSSYSMILGWHPTQPLLKLLKSSLWGKNETKTQLGPTSKAMERVHWARTVLPALFSSEPVLLVSVQCLRDSRGRPQSQRGRGQAVRNVMFSSLRKGGYSCHNSESLVI